MNSYLLTLILKDGLDEKERKELLESIKKRMGDIKKEDLWGAKELSYSIRRQKKGYYVHFEFESDPKDILTLDKNLKLEEDVLRYLIVRA